MQSANTEVYILMIQRTNLFEESGPECSRNFKTAFNSVIHYTISVIRMFILDPNNFLKMIKIEKKNEWQGKQEMFISNLAYS